MISRAACWKNGELIWEVTHDNGQGGSHLGVKGTTPAGFAAIRDRLIQQQNLESEEDADYIFNIPVNLAESITGYSHEKESPAGLESFVRPSFHHRILRRP